ncbi:MAG: hypothetical protein ACLQNG_08860 [Acidimicrobiales bacterium]
MDLRPSQQHAKVRGGLLAASTAALALAAAGCGSSPATGRAADAAAPLLQESAAAYAKVGPVHISGELAEKSGSSTVSIAVDATSAGAAGTAAGTLQLEGAGLGFTGSTHYIVAGGITYVNAGTPFWKSLFGSQTPVAVHLENEILPEVLNRWVALPASSTDVIYKDTFGLSEPKTFVGSSLTGVKGTLTNSGNRTLNGVSGVQITSSTGAEILLAPSGPLLPLALADAEPSSGGFQLQLVVTYPRGVAISAPPHPVSLAAIEAALSP